MAKTVIEWEWQEAFQKGGFDDGDGYVQTQRVVNVLEELGYTCVLASGMHNTHVVALRRKGESDVEVDDERPVRWQLPSEVVTALDREFSADAVFYEPAGTGPDAVRCDECGGGESGAEPGSIEHRIGCSHYCH